MYKKPEIVGIWVAHKYLLIRMTDVVKDQNIPLLDQVEKKTKLPFCIFLLCNGAVGMCYCIIVFIHRCWYFNPYFCRRKGWLGNGYSSLHFLWWYVFILYFYIQSLLVVLIWCFKSVSLTLRKQLILVLLSPCMVVVSKFL